MNFCVKASSRKRKDDGHMDKTLAEKMRAYVASHKYGILSDLCTLVRIPSVMGEAEDGAPFGRKCSECLEAAVKLYEKNGFRTVISGDKSYAVASVDGTDKKIGLFAHLDVVPPDGEWLYADNPFEPKRTHGCLVGRGVEDNKSGAVLSLYAVKMLRDLGVEIKSCIEVFLGTNEESGMADIEKYVKENALPDVSIIPDGDFPVSIGERSMKRFRAVGKSAFSDIVSFDGGSAFNIVLGELNVKMRYSETLYREALGICESGGRLEVSSDGEYICVTAHGLSKHAGFPEGGVNAAFVFSDAFRNCKSLCENDRQILSEIAGLTGRFYGEGFGVGHDDPSFGRLTCVNGICSLSDGRPSLSFDVRFGVSLDGEKLMEEIRRSADLHGFEICDESGTDGFEIAKDNVFAKALERVYGECAEIFTGKSCADKAFYCSGGTYARKLCPAGSVAFSVGTVAGYADDTAFTMPQGHGGAHQPDEKLPVDAFLEAISVAAMMIAECDGILYSD